MSKSPLRVLVVAPLGRTLASRIYAIGRYRVSSLRYPDARSSYTRTRIPMKAAGLTKAGESFLAARDFVLRHRLDHDAAVREFRWPALREFNWALDYFDPIATGNDTAALHVVEESGSESVRSFAEMSRRSNQLANFLRERGVR